MERSCYAIVDGPIVSPTAAATHLRRLLSSIGFFLAQCHGRSFWLGAWNFIRHLVLVAGRTRIFIVCQVQHGDAIDIVSIWYEIDIESCLQYPLESFAVCFLCKRPWVNNIDFTHLNRLLLEAGFTFNEIHPIIKRGLTPPTSPRRDMHRRARWCLGCKPVRLILDGPARRGRDTHAPRLP